MKRIFLLTSAFLLLTGCSANVQSSEAVEYEQSMITDDTAAKVTSTDNAHAKDTEPATETEDRNASDSETSDEHHLSLLEIAVNGYALTAEFADTAAAQELAELLKSEPMVLNLHEYGSFEKVGALPQSLPKNDERITTEPGDIMLYLGNQITIFYGTNTWSYTPLGRISDVSQAELEEIFGDGDVTVTLSLSE